MALRACYAQRGTDVAYVGSTRSSASSESLSSLAESSPRSGLAAPLQLSRSEQRQALLLVNTQQHGMKSVAGCA
eukprot:3044064-Rhodomonas_salina.3